MDMTVSTAHAVDMTASAAAAHIDMTVSTAQQVDVINNIIDESSHNLLGKQSDALRQSDAMSDITDMDEFQHLSS